MLIQKAWMLTTIDVEEYERKYAVDAEDEAAARAFVTGYDVEPYGEVFLEGDRTVHEAKLLRRGEVGFADPALVPGYDHSACDQLTCDQCERYNGLGLPCLACSDFGQLCECGLPVQDLERDRCEVCDRPDLLFHYSDGEPGKQRMCAWCSSIERIGQADALHSPDTMREAARAELTRAELKEQQAVHHRDNAKVLLEEADRIEQLRAEEAS